jgi:hypothetical protein
VNAVRILIQFNISPLKEFDAWEAIPLKTYPALKTFMHEAYGHRLMAMVLCSTLGQNQYFNQMMYNIFAEENENESDEDTVMTMMQTAALTATPSSTGTEKGTAVSTKVATAINQLPANQNAMMAQMVALMMAPPTALHNRAFVPRETFHVLPI